MPHHFDKGRDYQIAPRFLAGSTGIGDPGLRPLLDAGWALSRDESGNVFVSSPDRTLLTGYLPESEQGDLWMINAYLDAFASPRWQVTLDLSVSPEIVGEFTTALADSHSAAPNSVLRTSTGGFNVTDRLLGERGWHLEDGRTSAALRSPDGLVTLHRRHGRLRPEAEIAGDAERWLFEVGPPGHRWYATATSALPDHLLYALTTAITDPVPVQRHLRRSELGRLPSQATAVPTVPSPLEIARVRAATARSAPASKAGTSALAYTTTTRPVAFPNRVPTGRTR
ncbi:DUF317 domain-containing protein [Kitasatospora griseola]|uniref:DUF317 domain-containing protein n=1 Tax=Kitasatospora griseola TaxID=2064 RepID=UPI0038042105